MCTGCSQCSLLLTILHPIWKEKISSNTQHTVFIKVYNCVLIYIGVDILVNAFIVLVVKAHIGPNGHQLGGFPNQLPVQNSEFLDVVIQPSSQRTHLAQLLFRRNKSHLILLFWNCNSHQQTETSIFHPEDKSRSSSPFFFIFTWATLTSSVWGEGLADVSLKALSESQLRFFWHCFSHSPNTFSLINALVLPAAKCITQKNSLHPNCVVDISAPMIMFQGICMLKVHNDLARCSRLAHSYTNCAGFVSKVRVTPLLVCLMII